VINLSSLYFTEEETNLLNYGLQFSLPSNELPLVDTVVNIESSIKYLPENMQSTIRNEASEIINSTKNKIHHQPKPAIDNTIESLNASSRLKMINDSRNTINYVVESMNSPAYMKYKFTNSNPRVPELSTALELWDSSLLI
jgi:hypothetical protein